MNSVINKTIEILVNKSKKIPDFLFILLIFVTMFNGQAKSVTKALINFIEEVLPKTFLEQLYKVNISVNQFVEIWSFLLVIMFMTAVWNIFKQWIEYNYVEKDDLGGGSLLYINSICLMSVLIYNKLTNNPLSLELINISGSIYLKLVIISLFFLVVLFSIIYLSILWKVVPYIWSFKIKMRYRLMWIIVYVIILDICMGAVLSS